MSPCFYGYDSYNYTYNNYYKLVKQYFQINQT